MIRDAQRSVTAHARAMTAARAAAAKAAAKRAAARRAAAKAAAQRAARQEAARQAAAEQAAAQQAAAQQAAAEQAAAQQAAAEQAAAQRAAAQKAAAERAAARAAAARAARQVPSGSPQQIAEQMLGQFGWASQFSCLDALWARESGWNMYAQNPSSGAYGIPQALPGSKMASAGLDWQSDAATQIRWGLGYIQGRYGSPCAAWAHEQATGWY